MPKTILIPIPISKSTPPRFRNSIEGLNQEIERIIIRDTVERDEIIIVSVSQQYCQELLCKSKINALMHALFVSLTCLKYIT